MSETFWNEQARIRADHVEHLRDIIRCLKTGTCWCGKGIDNPMVTEHPCHCNAAQREMSGIRHGGADADRWVAYAAKQLIYTSIPDSGNEGDQLVCADIPGEGASVPGGGVEPHGIDTPARPLQTIRDGSETPSNGGKHG